MVSLPNLEMDNLEMNEVSEERIKNFIAEISENEEDFLEDLSDEYGAGYLTTAIIDGDFNPKFLIDYIMGDDSHQFLKCSIGKNDFDQQLAHVLEVYDRITEAEGLIVKAVSVLTDYNRRIDNTFETAMNEFWKNTSHNPKAMLIELLEESIREP